MSKSLMGVNDAARQPQGNQLESERAAFRNFLLTQLGKLWEATNIDQEGKHDLSCLSDAMTTQIFQYILECEPAGQ
jgi:hypothetical protein